MKAFKFFASMWLLIHLFLVGFIGIIIYALPPEDKPLAMSDFIHTTPMVLGVEVLIIGLMIGMHRIAFNNEK